MAVGKAYVAAPILFSTSANGRDIGVGIRNLIIGAHATIAEAGLILGRLTPDGIIHGAEGVLEIKYTVMVVDPDAEPEP